MRPTPTCVLVANGAKASLLTYHDPSTPDPLQLRLIPKSSLANAIGRTRDSDTFSETRPGLKRSNPHSPRHGVDDHRQKHRQESEKRFATKVAEETGALCHSMHGCRLVVVAGPAMLGFLRGAFSQRPNLLDAVFQVIEQDQDLTALSPSQIHDKLASANLLPQRPRFHG